MFWCDVICNMDNEQLEPEPEQSNHFKIVQRNKKAAEQQKQQEEQPQPEPQPEQPQEQPGSGISDILKSATELLSNPILRQAIIKNPEVIKDLISENAGELEPVVYGFLQSNYPDVYEAVSKVNDKVDKPDARSGMIPQEQFKADIIDLDSQGYNLSQIAQILSDEYNKTIYAMQVSRVLKKAESEQEEEAKRKEQELKQPKPKVDTIASQVAQTIPVRPAPMPAPAFKIPDVMTSMYSNIISTLRWGAVAALTGILGFILGKVM